MTVTRAYRLVVATIAAVFLAAPVSAAPPQTIHYQGFVSNTSGPLNGYQSMTFKLFSASTRGTALWTETQSVTAANGTFSVLLGNVTSFASANLGFDIPYFLGITVGTDVEMTPRAALAMVPYAFRALAAETALTASTLSGTIAGSQVTGQITGATLGGSTLTQLQGQFVQAINVAQPQTNVLTVVDTGGVTASITVGDDGLPMISHVSGALRVVKCGNASCASGNSVTVLDSGNLGYTSISIGADGLPVLSYHDANNSLLKVAKCGNAGCSSGNTLATVDSVVWNPNMSTAIAIGSDGLPVITYSGSTADGLKVAKCGNAACSAGNSITVVQAGFASRPSIAVGPGGLPIISFGGSGLKVVKCGNAACTAGNSIVIVDSGSSMGQPSIAVGADALPVISYLDGNNGDLKVAKCGNGDCSSGNFLTVVDADGITGYDSSIAIGLDGLPVISYRNAGAGFQDLRVARCGNAACTFGNTITSVDTAAAVVYETAITIGADGIPLIAYRDQDVNALKVAKCANVLCAPYFRRR